MDRAPFPATRPHSYHWLFAALLLALFTFKFNDLFLPYFWDELGVYARAASYLCEHHLSLMPSSLPEDISRGHPLLFFFLHACALRIFGNNVIVAHVVSLLLSFLLLLVVYKKTTKYFGAEAGIVSAVILAIQPVFLAQSALVLPEVAVALFVLLSLTSYYEEKFLFFSFFATLGVFAKESAVVIFPAVICFSLFKWLLNRRLPAALKPVNVLLTGIPLFAFAAFLQLQKIQKGWYFFPYHIESVQFESAKFKMDFGHYFDFIFCGQGRYWIEKVLITGLVFAILKLKLNRRNMANSFTTLAVIFMFGYIIFSALSFYGERYVFVIIVIICILTAAAITAITGNKILIAGLTIFLVVIGFQHAGEQRFHYDADLGYRRCVNTLQSAIDYTAEISNHNDSVIGNFPCYFALDYVEAGYQRCFKLNHQLGYSPHDCYFIGTVPGVSPEPNPEKYNAVCVQNFEDGFARSAVYRLTPK